MLSWPSNIRVFVCTTPTDMRKQFDGLHALVTQVFGRDVFDGHLFLFFNRRRDRRRSERHADAAGQLHLDFGDLPAQEETPSTPEFEDVTIRRRKKGDRPTKPRSEELPAHLERRDEVIDVPESERAGLVKIGEDVTERLEFDRMKPWVRRIIRPKYARPGDAAAGVQQAPPPLGVIEGGRYGFSVVIEVLIQKYLMHARLYRQQNLFAQIGWAPSRSTLCQIVAASRRAAPPSRAPTRSCATSAARSWPTRSRATSTWTRRRSSVRPRVTRWT